MAIPKKLATTDSKLSDHTNQSLSLIQFHLSHKLSHMMHDIQYQLLNIANADSPDRHNSISTCIASVRKMDKYRKNLIRPIELIRYLSQAPELAVAKPYLLIRELAECDSIISSYVDYSTVGHEHDQTIGILDSYLLEQFFDGLVKWMIDMSIYKGKLDFSVHHQKSALVLTFKGMQPGTFHDLNHIENATDNHCYLLKSAIILHALNGTTEKTQTNDSLSENISIKYPLLWRNCS